jgi:hypothetical protein
MKNKTKPICKCRHPGAFTVKVKDGKHYCPRCGGEIRICESPYCYRGKEIHLSRSKVNYVDCSVCHGTGIIWRGDQND